MNYQVDEKGYYGRFGGAYIPEILHKCVEDLQRSYLRVLESESFREEYRTLLRDYAGRPSPLYFARRLSERYGCRIYLKREDLNHTGAQNSGPQEEEKPAYQTVFHNCHSFALQTQPLTAFS